jgi:UDP-GlcNAc:undecaprenyl-phosphate GlcNAc-1-phosphate transferase
VEIFIAFLISTIITFLIIKYNYGLDKSVGNKDHAIHTHEVSRMGGVSIFIAIIFPTIFTSNEITTLLISTFSIFTFGLLEDRYHIDISYLKKIIFISLSSFAILYISNEYAINGGFIMLNTENIFEKYLAIFIAFIGMIGFASAINFIDGLNGYAMGIVSITLIFFSYIFFEKDLTDMFLFSTIMIGAILGFIVFNFPFGKIFLGDMGAHWIGFFVAFIGIYLSNHTAISLWYPLAALSIPVFETFVTVFRRIKRKIKNGVEFSESEKSHLHHLIYNVCKNIFPKNSKNWKINSTSSLFFIFWHTVLNFIAFYFREDYKILISIFVLNLIIYLVLYKGLKRKFSL